MENKPCEFVFLITCIFVLTICVFNVPFAIVENNNCKTYSEVVSNQPSKTYYIPAKGLCPSYSKFSTSFVAENVSTSNATVSALATSSGSRSSSSSSRSTTSSTTLLIIYSRDSNDDDGFKQNINYSKCRAISATEQSGYLYAMICLSYTFFYIFVYTFSEMFFVFGTYIYFGYDHDTRTRLKHLYLFYFLMFTIGLILWNFAFIFGTDYWKKSGCKSYTTDGFNVHIANSIFMFFLCVYSFIVYNTIYIPAILPTSVGPRKQTIREAATPPPPRQPETNVLELNHIQRRIGAPQVVAAVLAQAPTMTEAQVDITARAVE